MISLAFSQSAMQIKKKIKDSRKKVHIPPNITAFPGPFNQGPTNLNNIHHIPPKINQHPINKNFSGNPLNNNIIPQNLNPHGHHAHNPHHGHHTHNPHHNTHHNPNNQNPNMINYSVKIDTQSNPNTQIHNNPNNQAQSYVNVHNPINNSQTAIASNQNIPQNPHNNIQPNYSNLNYNSTPSQAQALNNPIIPNTNPNLATTNNNSYISQHQTQGANYNYATQTQTPVQNTYLTHNHSTTHSSVHNPSAVNNMQNSYQATGTGTNLPINSYNPNQHQQNVNYLNTNNPNVPSANNYQTLPQGQHQGHHYNAHQNQNQNYQNSEQQYQYYYNKVRK